MSLISRLKVDKTSVKIKPHGLQQTFLPFFDEFNREQNVVIAFSERLWRVQFEIFESTVLEMGNLLGPRGPLIEPSISVRPSRPARPQEKSRSPLQPYRLISKLENEPANEPANPSESKNAIDKYRH